MDKQKRKNICTALHYIGLFFVLFGIAYAVAAYLCFRANRDWAGTRILIVSAVFLALGGVVNGIGALLAMGEKGEALRLYTWALVGFSALSCVIVLLLLFV